MPIMDELEIARTAVRRGLFSEEQLREAQAFAAGGRSLVSVLLDLGYLRSGDFADLLAPGARSASPAPSRSPFVLPFLLVAVAIGTAALTYSCSVNSIPQGQAVAIPAPPQFPPTPPAPPGSLFSRQLVQRAVAILSTVESSVRHLDTLQAKDERDLQRAAALLEEATLGYDGPEAWIALGRTRELLDRWDSAAEAYQKAIECGAGDAASLGLARILILVDRPLQAHAQATALCSGLLAGEAYLVRAQAELRLGNRDDARRDLDRAAQRDPGLALQIRRLRTRLEE